MLVSNNVFKNRYVYDGAQFNFPISFPFLDEKHIQVRYAEQGQEDIDSHIMNSSHYMITGVGNPAGGVLTRLSNWEPGIVIVIIRDVPITQLHQYTQYDNFPAESHEDALAKLTMICQELDEICSRAITVPVTSKKTPQEWWKSIYDEIMHARDQILAGLTLAGGVTGATMVVADGTTTPRSISDRFSDILTIKDFGAKGDGVADDTAAFENAAASGQTVLINEGNYIVRSDIKGSFIDKGNVQFTETDVQSVSIPSIGCKSLLGTSTVHWTYYVLDDEKKNSGVTIYITKEGNDNASSPRHGSTIQTAFATFDAAVIHAKKYYKNVGRHNTYTFAFGPGEWDELVISGHANILGRVCITSIYFDASRSCFPTEQGSYTDEEYEAIDWPTVSTDAYPYGTDRWATFTRIRVISQYLAMDIRGVRFDTMFGAYANFVRFSDVRIVAASTQPQPYAFIADIQCVLAGVNNITWEEDVQYSNAPFVTNQFGCLSLENGDGTVLTNLRKTTLVRLLGKEHILTSRKFVSTFASTFVGGNQIYQQLTYAKEFKVDASAHALSRYADNTYHYEDNDLKLGGACAEQGGDKSSRGYRIFANGYGEEWIDIVVSNIPTGISYCSGVMLPRLKFHDTPFCTVQTLTPSVEATLNTVNTSRAALLVDFNNTYTSKKAAHLRCKVSGILRASTLTDVNNTPLMDSVVNVESFRPRALYVTYYGTHTVRIGFSTNIQIVNANGSNFKIRVNGTYYTITSAYTDGNKYSFVYLTITEGVSSTDTIIVSGDAGAVTGTYSSVQNNAFNISNREE